ncbi:MAG: AcvB/VirJ family lysyl-phosphatidylglycerol hydrolase [Gammaproteobacteria bacterium]|nr:MAG: AcvB/VirJ family lysyl-phosphatidylglycerol hydrolase [Gammaproteobacteria bacterium]
MQFLAARQGPRTAAPAAPVSRARWCLLNRDRTPAAWAARGDREPGCRQPAHCSPPAAARLRAPPASPGREAHFRFSLLDWFNVRKSGLPTTPAILKLDHGKKMCIYGVEDRRSVCPSLPSGVVTEVNLPGGHHLGGDYGRITTAVLARPGIPGPAL